MGGCLQKEQRGPPAWRRVRRLELFRVVMHAQQHLPSAVHAQDSSARDGTSKRSRAQTSTHSTQGSGRAHSISVGRRARKNTALRGQPFVDLLEDIRASLYFSGLAGRPEGVRCVQNAHRIVEHSGKVREAPEKYSAARISSSRYYEWL